MKLFATKKKGKHVKKKTRGEASASTNGEKSKKGLNLGAKIGIGVILGITALALGGMAYLKLAVTPPDFGNKGLTTPPVIYDYGDDDDVDVPPTDNNSDSPIEVADDRKPGQYTFLIMGSDDGNGNTDVMMVATLDTVEYTLNVVNIPRDTLMNVSWTPRKVNTLYSVSKKKDGKVETGGQGAIDKLADILGYKLDFFVLVDLDAFVTLVDEVGGIYYDVPRNMNYDDDAQNLHIHISKGPQTLKGKDALGVVRWRQNNDETGKITGGYPDGDIGRIDTQQDFLKEAVRQILENKKSISVKGMADIVLNNVDTNLKLNEMIWLAQELLKLDAEKVTFATLPGNYNDYVGKQSYVTIYVNEWIDMINEKLNPFKTPVSLDNLSIYTRNSSDKLYTTNGVYASGNSSWGNGSSSSGGSTSTPTPAPTATPTPTPTSDNTDNTDNTAEPPVSTDNQIDTDTPTPPVVDTPDIITETPDPQTPPPAATPPDDGGSLFYTGTF